MKLVVFGEDWGAHPSSTQHLVRCLQADVDVIWINSIGLRPLSVSRRDLKRAWQKLTSRQSRQPAQSASESVFPIVHPKVIPLAKSPWLKALNRWLLRRAVKPYLQANDDTLVWASLPSAIDYKGCFNERAWWYYCGDDFGALAGVDHKAVTQLEAKLVQQAQVIFTASEQLQQKFPRDKTVLLEHGVSIDLFGTPAERAKELSESRTTIGFYGAIAEWVDQELLIGLARERPNYDIVMVGSALVDVSALEAEPNIHLVGARAHHELPSYSQHWQFSILPFKNNAQILACNPLKLREYLAAGRPVLSTYFPALEPYQELVEVAANVRALVEIIDRETIAEAERPQLAELNKLKRQFRVIAESWQARAQIVRNLMQPHSQNENA